MRKICSVLAAACVLLGLCAGFAAADRDQPGPEPAPEPTLAQRTLAGMTTEEKIGQLFIVLPEELWTMQHEGSAAGRDGYSQTALTDEMRAGLAAYPVGGVAFFSPNISTPQQLRQFIADLQDAAATPLFIAVDEEGGPVARLGNAAGFDVPHVGAMAGVGATGDEQNAYDGGYTIGRYLADYGFNLDFAPVADVNTNPNNPVIGRRAFGSDPALAARMVPALLDGLHDAGVMGCIKHFPGHGDTSADTHAGYVSVRKTWDEMLECELVSFIAALDSTDMVMAAHITAPNVTDDGLPVSLSRQMITGRLREELGYDGVVITDGLGMGAVSDSYGPGEAALLAFQAGADILLLPADPAAAFDAIRAAVEDGTVSAQRLDESVLRILTLKEKYGLLDRAA